MDRILNVNATESKTLSHCPYGISSFSISPRSPQVMDRGSRCHYWSMMMKNGLLMKNWRWKHLNRFWVFEAAANSTMGMEWMNVSPATIIPFAVQSHSGNQIKENLNILSLDAGRTSKGFGNAHLYFLIFLLTWNLEEVRSLQSSLCPQTMILIEIQKSISFATHLNAWRFYVPIS